MTDQIKRSVGQWERERDGMLLKIEEHVRQIALHQRLVDQWVSVLRSPDTEGECLASWTDIGRALGVTRTTAQWRYRHLSGPEL